MPAIEIRPARPGDVPAILALIHELATYERAGEQVQAAPADLHAALFAEPPAAGALVAAAADELVGMAVYFRTFSTWTGRQGMHLEDLFVSPAVRGRGVGRALLAELARICERDGLARLEWAVLTWNEPAIRFYRGLGAAAMEEWRTWRLPDAARQALATPGLATPASPAG